MKTAHLRRKVTLLCAVALISGSSAITTGCSSLALGDDEFSCKMENGGVPCASTAQMYEMTHNGQTPAKLAQEKKLEQEGKDVNSENQNRNGESDFVLDNFVTNRLPNEPIPVRTPPQVMRIWVAPYEDKEGDFVMSGYVYTEVSPRRWTLGVNSQDLHNTNLFQPLDK
ncbi:MAG: type IV conjugative transfer system lipoprotein TraV [Succinivibrio sp.]